MKRGVAQVFLRVMLLVSGASLPNASADAQRAVIVPEVAKKLVVQVRADIPPPRDSNVTPEPRLTSGSGIILGRSSGNTALIATARHVIRSVEGDTAVAIQVFVYPDTQRLRPIPARVVRAGTGDLDLAVLAVPATTLDALGLRAADFERLGEDDRIQRGELVKGIGCPNQSCWGITDPELRFLVSEGEMLLFDPRGIHGGDSGGALFDERGEVLGMVISQDEFRSRAIRISSLIDQLQQWNLTHQFRHSRYPRRGYSSTVGFVALSGNRSGRLPGARGTVVIQLNSFANWHFGGLRQTSTNVSLSSGIVGASLVFRRSRVVLSPFVDVGLGQVDAQFDGGGYYRLADGQNRYVPYWRPVQGSAIGGGGGVSVQVFLVPRLAAEVLAARWRFNTPQQAPSLPASTIGVGLRWALSR